MKADSRLLALLAPLLLAACVQTVASIVTLPVKVASRAVDLATTSQSEKDEKAGKQMRKEDEERGRLYREAQERCRKGRPLPTDDCSGYAPR
jgi:uncharacterized lipoprotein YajG